MKHAERASERASGWHKKKRGFGGVRESCACAACVCPSVSYHAHPTPYVLPCNPCLKGRVALHGGLANAPPVPRTLP